jgi:hypothetical protein
MAEKGNSPAERKITAYPTPKNHKQLIAIASTEGGVSKVVNNALKCYFESKAPLDNGHKS